MPDKIIEKPKSFYDNFVRKGSVDVKTTHYCPGCGHGNIHKYIAMALDELGLRDETILISPVGCSVFAYYYFDTGNIQVPHGRAPAVGTGLKRVLKDKIVISYQGDGDLAAIGGNNIIQAANRGENITVFFVNNAIYGMTGGQLAPTTLIGQKTTTSPYGRSIENEGYPVQMCELIASMKAPVYIERTMLTDSKHRMKTRKAIKKVIQAQKDGKGFSFVEILAPCPTGWKMKSVDACKHVETEMQKVFPLGVFRDEIEGRSQIKIEKKDPTLEEIYNKLKLENLDIKPYSNPSQYANQNVRIAGFGGQGVLMAGVVMSVVGMYEGLYTTWLPSYGPEMRGGTANCHVKISGARIGSPLVPNPNTLIVMNEPSLDTFEDTVEKDGLIIVNSSIIARKVKRNDVKTIYLPATDMAAELGLRAAANMIILGAYIEQTKALSVDALLKVLPKAIKKKEFVEINVKAINAGREFVKKES